MCSDIHWNFNSIFVIIANGSASSRTKVAEQRPQTFVLQSESVKLSETQNKNFFLFLFVHTEL